jgi:hypothetical protein
MSKRTQVGVAQAERPERSEFSSMALVGYLALPTMISCARMVTSTAFLNDSVSKASVGRANLRRFSDARLHAELSRNMYSEHGFEALMRSVPEQVCQLLMVVSYCMPGSPHSQAACEMARHSSRALKVPIGRPSRTARVVHSRSFCTASMNSSVTRIELFEFWKKTDLYASPSNEPS